MMDLLNIAKRGLVPVLNPKAHINPIHGADLARFTIDHLDSDQSNVWDVGGPEVFTWHDLAQTAFSTLNKRPRIISLPNTLLGPALRLIAIFSPRLADTTRFATWNMQRDSVAPKTGEHRLADFYAALTNHGNN